MNITIPATQTTCTIYNFNPTWVLITGLVVGFIIGVGCTIILEQRWILK